MSRDRMMRVRRGMSHTLERVDVKHGILPFEAGFVFSESLLDGVSLCIVRCDYTNLLLFSLQAAHEVRDGLDFFAVL